MNKFGRVLASVGVAGSLALGSGVVAATAAPTYQYYTVTVEASSSYAVAGGAVHITARGFLPGETLFVSFYGGAQPGWHEVADDNGEFEGSFTLPASLASGYYWLQVDGLASTRGAGVMIRVYGDDAGSGYGYYGAQIEVGSVTARPGGSVYLELSGFMPGEPIEIGVRSEYTKLAEWAADPAGGASGTVTLPSDLEPGQHTIVAIGLSSGRWVEAILNVVAEDVSDPDDDPDDADDSGDGGKKSGRLPGAANDAVSA